MEMALGGGPWNQRPDLQKTTKSSLKPPDANLIDLGGWMCFFCFLRYKSICCHVLCAQNQSFGSYPCPKIAISMFFQKKMGGWFFPLSQPSLQGEDRNLFISPIRMFDVDTVILHKFKAHGRLRRLTGTLQKTLQSLQSKMEQRIVMQGVAMLSLEYASMKNLRFETDWCSKGVHQMHLSFDPSRIVTTRKRERASRNIIDFRNLNPCGCQCHLPTSYKT